MKNEKLTHNDILLLILYVDNCQAIVGKTRIQKIVYLYEEEVHKQIGFDKKIITGEQSLFGFYPYHYGPFSDNLLKCLEELLAFNIISEEQIKTVSNKYKNDDILKYTLTQNGINYVKSNLLIYIDSIKIDLLTDFKIKYNNMIRDDLLYYVYNKYEKMTEKSLIKDQYIES